MSVVGFDFGNANCVVAVNIFVAVNDESKHETPAVVCFGEEQRFIGTAAAALMNPNNMIAHMKRLIALLLDATVKECCIGIPVYFTDLQRRAVLDVATIAGLNPLRLIHETTATALAYGIYETDLPENDPINIAFVDVEHSSLQVCIAAFTKGQLRILARTFDRNLGGRDFDEVLFRHFAAKFKEEYKIDVFRNVRACIKLRLTCEKLKKVLSANREAPLSIECLVEDKDVRGFTKREEFERINLPILERAVLLRWRSE